MNGILKSSTQQQNSTSSMAKTSKSPPKDNNSQPNDTIVLCRTFQVPPDPIIDNNMEPSVSTTQSEYLPSHDSDSEQERVADLKLWQKASETLKQRKMLPNKRPTLKEIRFLDGDIELQQFPQHLLRALEQNCRRLRTKTPTCARQLSKEKITLQNGREAVFRVRSTGEKLLQARFQYDKHRQIIVVRERTGNSINDGQAVIVTGIGGFPKPLITPEGETFSVVHFQIWSADTLARYNPKGASDVARLIKTSNEIEPAPQTPPCTLNAAATSYSPQQQLTEAANDIQSSDSFKSFPETIQSPSVERGNITIADGAYASDSDEPLIKSVQRKHAKQQSSVEASPSPGQGPDRQNRQAGSITAIVSSPPATDNAYHSPELLTPSRTTPLAAPFTPSSAFSSQATAAVCGEPRPTFTFKKTYDDPPLRTKSVAFCNTVEKLFAQASVASIITKDWLMLRLSVAAGDSSREVKIIRGDREDFEDFVQQAKQLGDIEIVVLPGDE